MCRLAPSCPAPSIYIEVPGSGCRSPGPVAVFGRGLGAGSMGLGGRRLFYVVVRVSFRRVWLGWRSGLWGSGALGRALWVLSLSRLELWVAGVSGASGDPAGWLVVSVSCRTLAGSL